MANFLDCASCAGFIPHDASSCPHCGETVARKAAPAAKGRAGLVGTIATAAAGGLMSLTLMACYGIAYTCENQVDKDGDGFFTSTDPNCDIPSFELDCNDDDANIHPDAPDTVGDGVDQNCDGVDGDAGTGGAGGTGGTAGAGGTGTTS
ncbi:MAG: putative metal-binding motif-containing protein [Polyangiaceae bacterium]